MKRVELEENNKEGDSPLMASNEPRMKYILEH